MLSLLDKTVRTAKWHGKPLQETIKASVKETLNGDFVLNFTYPITDSGLFRELKEDYLVRSPVPVLGHQLFRIKKVIEGDTSLEVVAYHISDDVMTRLVSPFRCEQVPCATALSSMVMASKSPLGDFSFTSDIVKNRTYTTDKEQTLYSILLDGKHSILGTWEGELVRDNLALSIKSERGQDRGVVISTHYNLKKYQRTKESSQIITRIHATSSFKQEGQDRETVLQVTLDSPLIDSYPFINEVTYTNNSVRTRQELIEWASSKFRLEGIDKPKDAIIIEAFELDGQTVHLGDTVTIKSKLHGIDVRKKAIAYDYDPLAKNYRSITFDDKASIGTGKTGGSLTTLANNLLDGNKRSEDVAVEIALENTNKAFDAEFEKRQLAIDNAIEQAQSRGEVYADRLKASIDSELSTIHQQMRQQEEEQQRTTRELLAKAGVNSNLATEAKQKAEQAQTGATEALRRAEQAKLDAIQEANRLTVTERSQTESKIATAKSQAITEASRLVDVAKALLSGQLATVSTNLSQTKEEIKLLASKQLVDSLTGRVTSAESLIQVQADQISQRVKTSDFNQAKQRIETAESSITQLGNRITTEISQTVAKIPTSIGGRNLFKGSRYFSDVWYNAGNGSFFEDYKDVHIHRTKTAWLGKSQRISVKSGEIYTFSFYAKSDSENDGIMFYLSHSGTGTPAQGHPNNKYIAISTDYQRYSITFKITSNGIIVPRLERTNTTSFLFFGGFKLETGSISSDWSPAPEDISNEIESVKTTITQTASGVEQVSTRLTVASGRISSSETQIRQLVSDVSSKVSQTDFNNLKRTVEGHTTTIQQTQQSILLKADKTVLEGVKTTADNALAKANTNASQITQTKADLRIANDAISQKVAKTDFNSLTSRVTSAETTIRTQAGQIEQRLTSTQVESAINSKGYQTKSQVDSNITGRGYLTSSSLQPYATTTSVQNLVKTSSDSFTQRISQTESRIPTSVSHRNLIAGTSDRWGAYQTINANSNWVASLGRVQFGDSSGIYVGSKVHLYAHISADEITFDPAVTARSMKLQGPILDSQNVWTWTNWNLYHPFYNKWSSNLTTGNNYRLIKLTSTITQEMYQHSKGFELQVRIDGVKTGKFHVRALMVSTGDIFPDYWTPSLDDFTTVSAFHEVRDTVTSHTRTIGDHTNQISQVVQTANGIVTRVGNLETSRATTATVNAIQTQVSTLAGAWSVRNLTSAGTVLSQLNLNKDGTVKIDGKLVQITGTTYIQDGVIASGKIASLDAGKITSGIISAARIGAEAITADKLKVDQAFFTKFMATEAYLKQLFAKSAFITQVQSVTLSANKISGGILSAINGAMKINLSLGNIKFFTNSPSISREVSGYPHQWVSFETGTSNGKPCGVTIIGSNRWNNWNANDGGFVGIRAWNGTDTDQIDVVGDKVRLASAPYTNPDGWEIVTLPNRLSIDAYKASDRPSSILNIGDIRIYRNGTTYVSLKDVLHQFNHNFKHLVNITGRGDVILTWDTIK
ncbi:gp58-like family protein [Streptococcus suis]|uniref:phage tail spike protein n=1 Tax=Streptococcus suis TaxID=1307 RepID=UPI00240D35CB|nr:phage tail spike protein [Streptococcus suis]WFA75201.1 gp58-like family protein [Streptococcus suis]